MLLISSSTVSTGGQDATFLISLVHSRCTHKLLEEKPGGKGAELQRKETGRLSM